jgi:hypothetical protein
MIGVFGNSAEKQTIIENRALFRVVGNNTEHFPHCGQQDEKMHPNTPNKDLQNLVFKH